MSTLPITVKHAEKVVQSETSTHGDGWYWRLKIKWEDANGHILHITNQIVARDDTGAGPLILNDDLYNELGQPPTTVRHGRGFGYQIAHRVMTEAALEENKYFWKIDSLNMDWVTFRPMFFNPAPPGRNDLSLMCTLGWKGQAILGDLDIGFLQKGGRRLVALGGVAAADCVTDLWK